MASTMRRFAIRKSGVGRIVIASISGDWGGGSGPAFWVAHERRLHGRTGECLWPRLLC